MTTGKNWNGRRSGAYYSSAERSVMQDLVKNSLTTDEYKTYKDYLANVKNLLPGCIKGDAGAKIELQKLLHHEGIIRIIEKVRRARQQGSKTNQGQY